MRISVPMTSQLEAYIDEVGYRDHPVLAACRAEAAGRGPMAVMQIAPEQGALLQLLVELTGARHVLEIGTFTGYSALAMALALHHDGRLVTCDNDPATLAIARGFWEQAGVADRIEARLGDAVAAMDELLAEEAQFDIILIDADKPSYPAYLDRAVSLVRIGGLIIVDDSLIHGRVATGPLNGDPDYVGPAVAAMRTVNRRLLEDERLSIAMIPAHDGLTLARRRF